MLSVSFANWVSELEAAHIVRIAPSIKPMSLRERMTTVGYRIRRNETLAEFFAARSSK